MLSRAQVRVDSRKGSPPVTSRPHTARDPAPARSHGARHAARELRHDRQERLDRLRVLVSVVEPETAQVGDHTVRPASNCFSCSCACSRASRLNQLAKRGHGGRVRDARLGCTIETLAPTTTTATVMSALSYSAPSLASPFPSTSVTIVRIGHVAATFLRRRSAIAPRPARCASLRRARRGCAGRSASNSCRRHALHEPA